MIKSSVLLITFLFGLMAVSYVEAYVKEVKICGLAPRAEVIVKLSDDIVVRKVLADENGIVLIKELHGEHFVFESTRADGKLFRLEISKTTPISPGILLIDCYKLF